MSTHSGLLTTALLLSCGCAAAATGSNAHSGVAGTGAATVGLPMAGTTTGPVGTGGVSASTGGVKPGGAVVAPPAGGTAPVAMMLPGTGGMMAPKPGTGGMGTGGVGVAGAGAKPGATPTPAGNMDPVIPPLPSDCPMFVSGTITYQGLGGIAIEAAPAPASPSAPMVFYWHGTGSFSGEYAGMAAAVLQGVLAEGGVLVSFQDTTGGDFLSGTAIFGMSDFKLADGLLACAVKNHNIDPRRIYTMGCSAGGLFSTAMAALRSSYIAAAAPNSGGSSLPSAFETKHTPALMTVHGMAGVDVVGIDFSQSSATADMAFKAAGGFVIDCDTGGGHCGGGGLAGDVWTFFKAHPFGVSPEPWTTLPPGFSTQCKIQ
jgi:dienelactone hydrolase